MSATSGRFSRHTYILWSAGAAVVVVVVGVVLFLTVFTRSVTVEGRHLRVRTGTTVGSLLEQQLVLGHAGDLISAKDRSVLKGGGGKPRAVLVNGKPAEAPQELRNGDVVVGENGTDVVEPVKVRTEAIPMEIRYAGTGPLETIVTTGSPGEREIRYGSISGQVVSTKARVQPVTRLVVRTVPASGSKLIALTFDDGPWPGQTAAILKILQANHVRATFFEIGRQTRAHPGLSRMLTDAGMQIGNHSETHPLNLGKLPAAQVASEITRAESDISAASGQRPTFFRPPGGNTSPAMYPVLAKLGMQWVQWDIDTEDWKEPPATAIVTKVLTHARPGAVVLMHDGGGDRSHTIAALPVIIQKLKAQGYVFVTVEELRKIPHVMG